MILPQDFENQMVKCLNKKEYDKLAIALNGISPTSLRFNQTKVEVEELFCKDGKEQDTACVKEFFEQVPWCATGLYLSERPQFTFDPLFHSGCYYVQEASSMYLAHVLNTYMDDIKSVSGNNPIVALDLCAAPGGKSTLIQSVLPDGSFLISNEVVRQRANVLAENISKWGCANSIVTNNYASDFELFDQTFDLVVCDVPCSGEGMFRKDPLSIDEWSLENVEKCWRLQREIISDIWHTLKDDGIMVYSTCTYNPHENEENIQWIVEELGAELLSSKPHADWNLTDKNTHFYPHKIKGEGFFIAVLRKRTSEVVQETSRRVKKNAKQSKKQPMKVPAEVKSWVKNSAEYTFYETNGTYQAFPTYFLPLLEKVQKSLKIVHAGIELATLKGKKLQPCHALALSNSLNSEAFPSVEIDYNKAIAYLRTEALQLRADTPRGYVLLTYKGHPLGFVNNIGSRANNLYPSEWRIKSTYMPTNQ